jgi:membrane fusion protein (multidrug efflux system)
MFVNPFKFIKNKRLFGIFAVVTAVMMLVVAVRMSFTESPQPAKDRQQDVTWVEVEKAEIRSILYKGFGNNATLEAKEDVILIPKVSGRLLELKVKTGEMVHKGQIVALLDGRDQDALVDALMAQIEVDRAEVAKNKVEMEHALRERVRYARLLKEGYTTKQELENKETAYQKAKAAYDMARAALKQAEANLKAQSITRSEYVLRSPIDGVVLDDYSLSPGTLLTTTTPVVRIANIDMLKAVLQIPEVQAVGIRKGMKALITVDGLEDREIEGEVFLVYPYVEPSTRTVQVEVAINNKNLNHILKPGMFAKVFIVERAAENAIVVPSNSVKDGKVFVIKNGKAIHVTVETGLETPNMTQITSGISPGDLIVVSGGDNLKDGDMVQIQKVSD